MLQSAHESLIIGGDMNLCRDLNLDKNSKQQTDNPNQTYRDRVQAMADSLLLTDVWRLLHPGQVRFTFRRGHIASRLDYWFTSDHLVHDSAS